MKQKSYHLLFLTGIAFLSFSFFLFDNNSSIDLHHKTKAGN